MGSEAEAALRHLMRVSRVMAVLGALVILMGLNDHPWVVVAGAVLLVGSLYLGFLIGRVGG